MIRILLRLLGDDAPILRRYLVMALVLGLLTGLTIALLTPLLRHLLAGQTEAALPWLAAFLSGALLCWLWRRRVEMAGVDVGVALLGRGRLRIGDHVASLPPGWFGAQNTARLNHVITHGVMEVAQLPAHVFTPVLGGLVVPVVVALALCLTDPMAGLVALLALPLFAAGFALTARFGTRADRRWQDSNAETSQRAVEFAQSQAVLRAFGAGDGARFLTAAIRDQRAAGARLIRLSILSSVLNAWVVQAVFALLLWLSLRHFTPETPPETLIGALVGMVLATRFAEPLLDVSGYAEALRAARGQLDEIGAIFAASPLREPDQPQEPQDSAIRARNLTFRHSPDTPLVLEDVSFDIAPGEMVALVGPSGAGKTTLLRLIARFSDPDSGGIGIGGVDLRQIGAAGIAARISQIFQDSQLISGTIEDNIRLGRPDASTEDLAEAIRLAGAEDILARLSAGAATEVGEAGIRLSGGERQRIGIARALLKRAPILLVDEATSALDAENEAAIARSLSALRGTCTLLVIAHRPATLAMADRILRLQDGKITDMGPPGGKGA